MPHGAARRAERGGGPDRRRPGRGDAPSRRGGDRRRRCAARRARSARARRDGARRVVERRLELDRREPARPSAPIASGSRSRRSRPRCTRATAPRRGGSRSRPTSPTARAATASSPIWRCSPAISRRPSGCSGAPGTGARWPTTTGCPRRSPSAAPSSRPLGCAAARRSSGPSARWRSRRTIRRRPARRPVAGARLELHRLRDQAHAALDRWLDDPSAPPRGTGFILLALKGFLLMGEGDLRGARAAFERSATREPGARSARRRGAVALRSHPRPVPRGRVGQRGGLRRARASRSRSSPRTTGSSARRTGPPRYVPAARGDWTVADAHVRAIHEQSPTFERHSPPNRSPPRGLRPRTTGPDDVLTALEPLEQMQAGDGVDDPAFLPWHHLKAHALVDLGHLDAAERVHRLRAGARGARARTRCWRRGSSHARGKLEFARSSAGRGRRFAHARALVEPLGMPYEQALIELAQGQMLRRAASGAPPRPRSSPPRAPQPACAPSPALQPLRERTRRVRPGAFGAQDPRLRAP